MKRLKKYMVSCLAVLLVLGLSGCQSGGSGAGSSDNMASSGADSSQAREEPSARLTDAAVIDAAIAWETEEYQDDYLTYDIPAGWERNAGFSNDANRFTFFTPSQGDTETPSNVNVQINSLSNQSRDMDYGNPEIQSLFHQFLLTEGGLPSEAEDGAFTVYQAQDFYVYSIAFPRTVNGGAQVEQAVYLPVGLDYSVTIWATDWKDGASPSAAQAAEHICATLQLKGV